MTNYENKPPLTRLIQVRCPEALVSAVQAAATSNLCSLSDVVRQSIIKEMRERGLINETV